MTVHPYSTGFISANFVARVDDCDRESIEEWGQLDEQTRREYDPTEAADWMGDVGDVGFDGVSLWTAHCWYHTADEI